MIREITSSVIIFIALLYLILNLVRSKYSDEKVIEKLNEKELKLIDPDRESRIKKYRQRTLTWILGTALVILITLLDYLFA